MESNNNSNRNRKAIIIVVVIIILSMIVGYYIIDINDNEQSVDFENNVEIMIDLDVESESELFVDEETNISLYTNIDKENIDEISLSYETKKDTHKNNFDKIIERENYYDEYIDTKSFSEERIYNIKGHIRTVNGTSENITHQIYVNEKDFSEKPNCRSHEYEGEGTVENPFKVYDLHDLQCIAPRSITTESGYYEFKDDIDATPTQTWNSASHNEYKGFEQLHSINNNIDGNNHTITGLYINKPDYGDEGLFDRIYNSTVSDINIENATIKSEYGFSAILASQSEKSMIDNISVNGTIKSEEDMSSGGLVGRAYNGTTIRNSNAKVSIESHYTSNVGGLVGNMFESDTLITQSYSDSHIVIEDIEDIDRQTYPYKTAVISGGLVGSNSGEITESYSKTMPVSNDGVPRDYTIGGIVGSNSNYMNNIYYQNHNDDWNIHAGKIAGSNNGEISNGYSTESITLIESPSNSDYNNIYYTSDNPDYDNYETRNPQDGTAVTEENLKSGNIRFDWDNVWMTVDDGYPEFQWQE